MAMDGAAWSHRLLGSCGGCWTIRGQPTPGLPGLERRISQDVSAPCGRELSPAEAALKRATMWTLTPRLRVWSQCPRLRTAFFYLQVTATCSWPHLITSGRAVLGGASSAGAICRISWAPRVPRDLITAWVERGTPDLSWGLSSSAYRGLTRCRKEKAPERGRHELARLWRVFFGRWEPSRWSAMLPSGMGDVPSCSRRWTPPAGHTGRRHLAAALLEWAGSREDWPRNRSGGSLRSARTRASGRAQAASGGPRGCETKPEETRG